MKKIVCFLVAALMLASALGLSAYANMVDGQSSEYIQNTTNARDLQAYGIHTFTSYHTAVTPVIDGTISTGEYPGLSDRATVGDGLWFTDLNAKRAEETIEDYTNVVLESYLAFDETYAYIAECITSPIALSSSRVNVPVIIRYGLNQSELVPESYSCLKNTYTFKKSTNLINSLSGNDSSRSCLSLENGVVDTKDVKIIAPPFPYVDGSNVEWNAAEYKKAGNVGSSLKGEGPYTYVYEFRIPLTEIAYSAFGSLDDEKTAQLIAHDTFFGSYGFSFEVSGNVSLATSIPGDAPCDAFIGKSDKSWTEALKDYYTTASGASVSQDFVPSPVYHFNTGDPSSVSVPAASKFRKITYEYGLDDVPTVFKMVNNAGQYKTGDYNKYFTFKLKAAGTENTEPYLGDPRTIPTQFRVRSGYSTKITGGFADFTTGVFDASQLPSGLYTLVVTFTEQKWDGTQWVNTGVTRNISRNITIAGSTRAATASSQTGDDAVLYISLGVLALSAAFTGIVLTSRKRKTTSI
ncbi:MAG: hypothetical protein J6Z79_06720 [Clostridia bacterium]|nr:hypothetical protein [Clostridia bacterium]